MEQELLFAIHPILHELKVNEDGSVIIWQGKNLKITSLKDARYKAGVSRRVHFRGRTYRVARLVCECWHGMGEIDQKVHRHDAIAGDHFGNLFWATHKEYMAKYCPDFKYSKCKIQPEQHANILMRLKNGETLAKIASSYRVTAMVIWRIKKKYATKQLQ